MTRAHLCVVTGLAPTTIWRIERGYVEPHPATRRLVAAALEADEADLFGAGGEA
jgi:transcriptional regulator with XRE-family HTH domain